MCMEGKYLQIGPPWRSLYENGPFFRKCIYLGQAKMGFYGAHKFSGQIIKLNVKINRNFHFFPGPYERIKTILMPPT